MYVLSNIANGITILANTVDLSYEFTAVDFEYSTITKKQIFAQNINLRQICWSFWYNMCTCYNIYWVIKRLYRQHLTKISILKKLWSCSPVFTKRFHQKESEKKKKRCTYFLKRRKHLKVLLPILETTTLHQMYLTISSMS